MAKEIIDAVNDLGDNLFKAVGSIKDSLDERIDAVENRINRTIAFGAPGAPHRVTNRGRGVVANSGWAEFARQGRFDGLTSTSGPGGDWTVPTELARDIVDTLAEISPVRSQALVMQARMPDFSIVINKRGTSSGWVANDQVTRSLTSGPALGLVTPQAHGLYAVISAANWLIQDSQYPIGPWLLENIATEFAVQEGIAFLTGDGAGKPEGILSRPTSSAGDDTRAFGTLQTVPSGSASTVTADAVIDLMFSLKPSYRQGDGVCFMANSATVAKIRKLKSGDGNYLLVAPLSEGQPSRLLGYPLIEAEAMPDIASGAHPLIFGNFRRGYVVLDRMADTIIRDDVTVKGQTLFYVERRLGGCVLDSNALKVMEIGT